MTFKIIAFSSILLLSSVLCDKDIVTNFNTYIKQLVNLDKLKTKIKTNLGNTEEAAWATIQSKK